MDIVTLLVILLVMGVLFGGYGYNRRTDWGPYPSGIIGFFVLVILLVLILKLLHLL
jgi:hypothetical protein